MNTYYICTIIKENNREAGKLEYLAKAITENSYLRYGENKPKAYTNKREAQTDMRHMRTINRCGVALGTISKDEIPFVSVVKIDHEPDYELIEKDQILFQGGL